MNKIVALIDYKNKFGSKHFDTPYRSGLDKSLLKTVFYKRGYEIEFIPFHKLPTNRLLSNPVIYTSSEDIGYQYKDYIEDIVLGLETSGNVVLPAYKYLRANNNKVFMEILRQAQLPNEYNNLKSFVFGCIEELQSKLSSSSFNYPIVIKKSAGANGKGVFKAENSRELFSIVGKISRTKNLKFEIRDRLRKLKHKGYIPESRHRQKFILQEFIPNLTNDWKIYVFGSKLYIFKRPVFKHRGFRASGGGYDNYYYDQEAGAPDGLFDYAYNLFNHLDVPHASLDIAFDGKEFYLIEFQLLYFGTAGIPYSKGYFTKTGNDWQFVEMKLSIEQAYAESIVEYLQRKQLVHS